MNFTTGIFIILGKTLLVELKYSHYVALRKNAKNKALKDCGYLNRLKTDGYGRIRLITLEFKNCKNYSFDHMFHSISI